MRLLRAYGEDSEELKLETFNDERKLPKYAILSHTWLADTEEVTFRDLNDATAAKAKKGWKKLHFARVQAWNEDIEYVWLDTCCIDKSSSAELAEAINSMYRWYKEAAVCYVYLDDLPPPIQGVAPAAMPIGNRGSLADKNRNDRRHQQRQTPSLPQPSIPQQETDYNIWSRPPHAQDPVANATLTAGVATDDGSHEHLLGTTPEHFAESHEMADLPNPPGHDPQPEPSASTSFSWDWAAFRKCRWFTRGWTLQEMIAPSELRFYNQDWDFVGTLASLADLVADITSVHKRALTGQWPVAAFSIAQKMCWAAERETTRAEDRAYSLLGIFDVSMPVVYGEGERAFIRLQQELLRVYSDQTIFAWLDGREAVTKDKAPVEKTNPKSTTVTRTKAKKPRSSANSKASLNKPSRQSHLLAESPLAFKGCERMVPVEQDQPYRAYQVSNREVSFELPIYTSLESERSSFFTVRTRAVLSCCLEDDPTKIICLKLQGVAQTASYYVGGIGPRIAIEDLYDVTPKCTMTAFSVLLSVDQAQKRERVSAQDTIACRFKGPKGPGTSGLRFGYVDSIHTWKADSNCFLLPSLDPNDNKADHSFSASIAINRGTSSNVFAELRLFRGKTAQSPLYVQFHNPSKSTSKLTIAKFTNTAPLAISYHQRLGVSANVVTKRLLREKMTVVELEIVSLWRASWLLYTLGLVVLFSFALLPGTVLVPIITLWAVRKDEYDGYAGDTGPVFDKREVIGLAVGLTFSCLIAIWGLFFDDPLPLQWRPKSWRWGMPWVLSLACLSLCGVYDRNANRHRPAIDEYKAIWNSTHSNATLFNQTLPTAILSNDTLYNETLLTTAWDVWDQHSAKSVFTIMVLRTTSSAAQNLTLIIIAFLDKTTRYALFLAGLNLATLVPLLLIQVDSKNAFAPWTTKSCQQQLIPEPANWFYNDFARRTNQTYAEACAEFSNEGRLVWSVLSLGLWELALELLAIFELMEVVFHVRRAMRNAWKAFEKRKKMVKQKGA